MTNWYAVAVGFVVELVVGGVGALLPGVGQLAAGLLGGRSSCSPVSSRS